MDLEEIPWWGWALGVVVVGGAAAAIASVAVARSIAGTSQTVTYKGFTIKVTCGGLSLGQAQACGAMWQVKVTWASGSTFNETVTAETPDAAIAAAKAKIDLYDSTTVPA